MDVKRALYQCLSGYAGLTALVGSRIYPNRAPQNCTMPAVVYQQVTDRRTYTKDGYAGLAWPLFQISCYAETYEQAEAVRAQVEAALHACLGKFDGLTVEAVRLEGSTDQFEDGSDLHRVLLQVRICCHQ